MASAPSTPRVFAGRFTAVSLLKSGQDIETWIGEDRTDCRPAIIKTVPAATLPRSERQRLTQQAKALGSVTSPFLTAPLQIGLEDGLVYAALPFVHGLTLEERLRAGPLSIRDAIGLGCRLMKGLVLAHAASVLHKNIKPTNVIINADAQVRRSTLIDFGFARSGRIDSSIRDQPVSDVRYVSPEQAGLLEVNADERSDLYSAGVVLFECLAGRPPFTGSTVTEVLRQHMTATPPELRTLGLPVPRALDEVLQRLLRKDPRDRYHSAAGVLADLAAIEEALDRGETDPAIVIGSRDQRPTLTEPAFVGRAGELGALGSEVERARHGHGRLVLMQAESGGGKTRILQELSIKSWHNAWVLRGQGVADEAPRPFQMLAGVAEQIMAVARAEPDYARALRHRLADDRDAVAAAVPELADVLQTKVSGSIGPEAFGEARTINALSALLDALGSVSRPALVILDDAQGADELMLSLLLRWHQRRQASKGKDHVALVVSFRSDEVAADHPLRQMEDANLITLAPLSAGNIRQMAESMAGVLPEEAQAVVEQLSGGSPFMASAVLRGLVECGALVHESAGWRVEPLALDDVRSSRQAAAFLSRRLDQLPTVVLDLLGVGAVLGKEFDLDLAASLAGQSAAAAIAAVDEVRRRHIIWIRTKNGRCAFVHDKLREALLGRLGPELRRDLHGKAAMEIEAHDRERCFEIAYHYDEAGEPQRALLYALTAGDRARAQHALAIAEQQFRIAIRGALAGENTMRMRAAEGLGDVLTLRGQYDEAAGELTAARALAGSDVDRARIEGKLGDLAFKRGDTETACTALERALRLLGRPAPRTTAGFFVRCLWEVLVQTLHTLLPRLFVARRRLDDPHIEDERLAMRLYSRLAHAYWFARGRIPCAWTHLRGMNLAERYPPTAELAQAYSEHAPVMTMLPAFKRGIAYAQKSLAIRRELGDIWGQGQSLHFYGVVLYGASQFEACIAKCREAVRLLERTGDRWELNTAAWHIAFSQYRLGDLRSALETARRVHRDGAAIGDAQAMGISLGAWSKASAGHVPDDLVKAELARGSSDVHTAAEVLQAEALRLLRAGQNDDAVAALERADQLITARGFRQEYVSPVLPWLATALRARVEATPLYAPEQRKLLLKKAARIVRRAVRLARSYRNNLPHALREAALFASACGRRRRARALLDASHTVAEQQGARYEMALTLLARARLAEAAGMPEAQADLALARQALEAIEPEDKQPAAAQGSGAITLSMADRFDHIVSQGRQIASALTKESVLAAVKEAALVLLRGERCAAVEVSRSDGGLTIAPTGDHAIRVRRSIVTRALDEGRPLVVTEAAGESETMTESMVELISESMSRSADLAGLRSVLCAPILVRGRPVAVLYVTHSEIGHLFGHDEERLAQYITTLAGAAWLNAEGFLRAEEAVAVRDEFLAIASHELKTPLTSLGLRLEKMQRELGRSGPVSDNLLTGVASMTRQTHRLDKLVESLLDVSQMRGGRMSIEPDDLDLSVLVRDIGLRLSDEATRANCALTIVAPAPAMGRWDPLRLEQVVTNLLTNAIKYGAGAAIEVRVSNTPSGVKLEVEDHGIGLGAQDAARIFGRFERAVPASHYGGLGLGLYITREIVRAHGGEIVVTSTPGKGSVFTVTLPRQSSRVRVKTISGERPVGPDGSVPAPRSS
ncbi:MAG TPA: ATP-binding protein [Polyangia bacterium]|jgi:signal transduction histidine kinase/tetratricopeptide (TPR) repeat protein|nr:ATP-binding protein [Polyangia bacterium]